jgi:transposase
MLVNSTVSDVVVKEDLGYEAVMGIVNHHIAGEVDWNRFERLDEIGIDEIALKKGHKDFVTVVTARLEGKTEILGVLKDRRKATVKAFFLSIPNRLRKTVRVICSDLYEGFINAAKEVFGRSVPIVADRFHVARLYRKGLETLRKQELKRLKKTLPEEAYQQLKGALWALRKGEEDLTPEDKALLERLFQHSPRLKMAHLLSNALTEVFAQDLSKSDAKREIRDWMDLVKRSGLRCFDRFLATLGQWKEEITNYFIDRSNSGFVEGLNNKIKVIKRRCYSLLNVKHLFQRLYLDLSGYALFA